MYINDLKISLLIPLQTIINCVIDVVLLCVVQFGESGVFPDLVTESLHLIRVKTFEIVMLDVLKGVRTPSPWLGQFGFSLGLSFSSFELSVLLLLSQALCTFARDPRKEPISFGGWGYGRRCNRLRQILLLSLFLLGRLLDNASLGGST